MPIANRSANRNFPRGKIDVAGEYDRLLRILHEVDERLAK
jgi:hypothetical protein